MGLAERPRAYAKCKFGRVRTVEASPLTDWFEQRSQTGDLENYAKRLKVPS